MHPILHRKHMEISSKTMIFGILEHLTIRDYNSKYSVLIKGISGFCLRSYFEQKASTKLAVKEGDVVLITILPAHFGKVPKVVSLGVVTDSLTIDLVNHAVTEKEVWT